MTYNRMFESPSENEQENAAVALQIIEETAKLCGLLGKAVMETTKDDHLAEKLIVEAVRKAEKQLEALGFDNNTELSEALSNIRCTLPEWDIGDEGVIEQDITEHFFTAKSAAQQVEEDTPSNMQREHGTHYGL